MNDQDSLLAANLNFYTAFSTGDIEDMGRIWADSDSISCIHPGWPPLIGRDAVMASWRDILLSPQRPQIICHEPHAVVAGDDGRIVCIERIGNGALAACNQFRRIDGIWRLVHHQASPMAVSAASQPADDDRPSASDRIH